MTDSADEIKNIKLELSSLTKNIQTLSIQFDQMNSLLYQLLSGLDLAGEYADDDEAMDFIANEKMLNRINELKNSEDPNDHSFQ